VRNFLRVAVIVYVAYLATALLVISPVLNLLPHWYMQDTYGRELRTGWVLFNPFKISLDISEAQLSDNTGERFIGFSEASIDLSLHSLWQPGWVLDTVKIRGLYVDVTRLTQDEYSFSDLLPNDTAQETPEKDDSDTPGLTIHDLELHSETVVLTDQARELPYSSRWNGLHIRGTDISTVVEKAAPFSVDVEAEDGGTLHWEGQVSLQQGSSAGSLSLSNLNLRKLWQFAQPWLQFELKDGQLAVKGEYDLNWRDTFIYRINNGHIGFSAIDIAPLTPAQLPDTALGLSTLDMENIALDSSTQQITIDTVALEGLTIATWMEGSQVSLQQLFVVNLPADPAATQEKADEAGWKVALNKAQLRNGKLQWRSQLTDPRMLSVQPVEATLDNLNWPLSGDSRLSLKLTVNEQANIAVHGALALAEGKGSFDYTLDGLPLTWFNPNLPKALKATVTGGEVEVKGQAALHDYAPTTIAMNGKIRGFAAQQRDAETAFTGWDTVRFDGLTVNMEQNSLVLEKLTINNYKGRLHIHEDGSVNALNIWKEEVGEQAQEIAEDLTEDKPWSFSIPGIEINDSQIDFMDQSLPIPFRAVIGELDGNVLNISSTKGAVAKVKVKGSVEGYAPVSLTGTVAPFATTPDLDLNLTFDGVDMALLSPYTGTYAGYAIEQGLLDLDLHYALQDNKLKGHNALRIEKLKLGEKISSDKAVDLPLELALAILTDSKGVIDMAVPVTGDINNPKFNLGSVIATAFLNIITKAITAPFTLLANLVSSEDDLQRITFTSGSAQLRESNKEKLTQLAAALAERPKLSLLITGRLQISADRERLQKNTLKAQLLAQGLPAEEVKARGPDWEKAISERYKALSVSSADAAEPAVRDQYLKVAQSIAIPDTQMSELAAERAATVKRYLVNEAGLPLDRAVVGQGNLNEDANLFSGVELDIGS